MATMIDARCCNCQASAGLLDENGWCEQCVLGLAHEVGLLADVEDQIEEWLRRGYRRDHLAAAVEMSLADAFGPIAGGLLVRESVDTGERGVWRQPPSAFDEPREDPVANRIYWLRRMAGMTLESLARRLEVDPPELALWEAGALPPRDRAQAMAAVFEVSLSFLLKSDEVA